MAKCSYLQDKTSKEKKRGEFSMSSFFSFYPCIFSSSEDGFHGNVSQAAVRRTPPEVSQVFCSDVTRRQRRRQRQRTREGRALQKPRCSIKKQPETTKHTVLNSEHRFTTLLTYLHIPGTIETLVFLPPLFFPLGIVNGKVAVYATSEMT